MSKLLLVGGLGHTDLSGKVPRPGLLMLRQALKRAGHSAVITNYATSMTPKMFPPAVVTRLAEIYRRSIKPFVADGQSLPRNFWKIPVLLWDMRALKTTAVELAEIEKKAYIEEGKSLSRRVKAEGFDAVGFSMYLGGSTTASMLMAEILRREHPDLPIFFGGPQTTHFAEAIYRETQAPTALVKGEGEIAIVELANMLGELKAGRISDLTRVPNLVFRAEDGKIVTTARRRLSLADWIDLSQAPYEAEDFKGMMKYAFIEASRGCFYQCTFCPQPLLSGKDRLLKPAWVIVDEMVKLNRRFGIRHFELVGSSTPPQQAGEIADEIINRALQGRFSWGFFMRGKDEHSLNISFPNLMAKIRHAGASAVFFGVEAADNATLKAMRKGEKIEEIEAAMLAAKAAGLSVTSSFIYPYPGMPANEGDMIIDFLRRTRPDSASSQALGLFPGTFCSENAAELGCEVVYPDKRDQKLYLKGQKPAPSMHSPEVLSYLLGYRLISSLPARFWPPLPYKIDGKKHQEYIAEANRLQRQIAELGIVLGLSHTHFLMAQVFGISPSDLAERMFYCSVTGDYLETARLIRDFNSRVDKRHNADS